MTLGEKIQALRREAGLSQEGLADHLGVSRQAVSKWETNLSCPDSENLMALAELFHRPLDDFLPCGGAALPEGGASPAPKVSPRKKRRFLIPMGIAAAAVIALCFWLGHTPPEVAIDSPGAAQSTYIALTALENDRDLSTEEIYQYRAAIYANIPFLDWVAFGKLGAAGKETETQQMLLSWLAKQENLSETEIACLLAGACRTNLDGWMADGYCAVLAETFIRYPAVYVKTIAGGDFTDEERALLVSSTGYGCDMPEELHDRALEAVASLRRSGALVTADQEFWFQRLSERIKQGA